MIVPSPCRACRSRVTIEHGVVLTRDRKPVCFCEAACCDRFIRQERRNHHLGGKKETRHEKSHRD